MHVRLASNGDYWQAVWVDPQTGRRRAKGLGSKAKVKRKLAEYECQRLAVELEEKGQPVQPTALAAWCRKYLELRPDLKDSTLHEYSNVIALLLKHFGSDRRINTIREIEAAEFKAWLSQGRSEQTVRKILRGVKAIFGSRHGAVRYRLIHRSPFDGMSTTPLSVERDWVYVSEDMIEQVLDHCPTMAWSCLFALCRYAGLRRGEAMRLRWMDVDFDRLQLTIRSEDGIDGTKQAYRCCPIIPRLGALLLEAFEQADEGDERVLRIGDTSRITNRAAEIIVGSGLSPWSKPFHTLRKACRTDWDSMYPAMDVDLWMGHDESVARKHYHQTHSTTWARVTGRWDDIELHTQPGGEL